MLKRTALLERIESLIRNAEQINLNDWEKRFLISIRNQSQSSTLTPRQKFSLEKIEKKITPEFIQNKKKFIYDEAAKKKMKIIVNYYKHLRTLKNVYYYSNIIDSYEEDENWEPTYGQYISMCENEYAKKIIKETQAEPKYDVGSLAVLKFKNLNNEYMRELTRALSKCSQEEIHYGNKAFRSYVIILKNDSQVTSPVNGGKKYKIALFMDPKISFYIEERFLKKFKSKVNKKNKK